MGFMGIVLAILAGGQAVLGIWFVFDQRSLHREIMMGKAGMAASFLSNVYADAMKKGDYDAMMKYARDISHDEDIISIKALGDDGALLMQLDFSGERPARWAWNPFSLPWKNTVTEPVLSGGLSIGSIELVYSGNSANEALLSLMYKPAIAQTLIFALVIYAVYFFFQKKVGGPIHVIRDRMEKVTDGDLTVQIPDMGENEIGIIATGLRFIVQRLTVTVQGLNATAEKVARTVKELENTFDEFTGRIKKQTASTDEIALSLRSAGESQKKIVGINEDLMESYSENVSSLLEVKAMADEIVSSMDTLYKASESSYTTVAQMAQTSKAMTGSSQKILSSVEKTSASIEEIIASVREVERSAKESSALAENVREEAAKSGVNTVAEAVDGIKTITVKVESSVDIVRRLHERSRDVELILAVIREVTEQTGLLSLNAAILAERAGEYGKGFSVVADEMRALSGRAASSAKEIAGIIKTIRKEIMDVVDSIEEGMSMVKEEGEKVYKVGVTMSDILEAAYNSALMTSTIEKATEEQVRALEHVETAMMDISGMASGMAKTMEDQIKGSWYMLERVGEVKEIAEITKKGTDEQAAGTGTISRNFEIANEKVEIINNSVLSQKRINEGIVAAVEEIRHAGMKNMEKVQDVSESLEMLLREIDTLRKGMEVFRVR
jgi:methyl-accepting chemotaxis protein